MNFLDDLRPSQIQKVVISFEVLAPVLEPIATIRRFFQPIGLDHCAHPTIDNDDALAQQRLQFGGPIALNAHSCNKMVTSSARVQLRLNTYTTRSDEEYRGNTA